MIEQPYTRIRGASLPLIPVTLFKSDGVPLTPLLAVVDSGASISLFHAEIAELLGLDLTAGTKDYLGGIKDGVEVYIHLVRCKISRYSFPCKIAFSAQLTIDFEVLGRLDFFEKFTVLLDESDQKLYLTPRVS